MKLNSKSINYNVQTVDELVSLDGLENDTVVVTDEDRGGVFVYREDNVGTNNGGTIFNGWTRQYDGAVNVKWFGAVGDGVTDDTAAITALFNTDIKNIKMPDTYLVEYNTITLKSFMNIDGEGTGKIISNTDEHGKVLFFIKGKMHITIKNMSFETPSSYQTAILALNCAYLTIQNNIVYSCGLFESGSSAQPDYLLGGYYDGLSTGGIYSLTVGENKTSHILINNNTCIGKGEAATLSDNRRPAILTAYTDNATISDNTIDGYIHGIMWWGGDASPTVNGAYGNERKCNVLTISDNNINGITAGGDIWGSMGNNVTISGNQCGYSGDVGIDFEGCTNSTVTGNTIANRTNGGLAFGFINNNILATGNTVYTDTANIFLVHLFGEGSMNNSGITIKNNHIYTIGNVVAYIATSSTAYSNLTISDNMFKDIIINLPSTHRNLTIKNNIFNLSFDYPTSRVIIGAYNHENSGKSIMTIKENVITSDVEQSLAVSTGFYSYYGDTFGTSEIRLNIYHNDFTGAFTGFVIDNQRDNTPNASNLKINIVGNTFNSVLGPTVLCNSNGVSTVFREGNYYDNDIFLAYPYTAPNSDKWFKGEKTYSATPTAGGNIGWVCTQTGTPGTWKTFGAISA